MWSLLWVKYVTAHGSACAMHRRQIRPRKIDEFKRMPILRDEITANDGVDRFFQYDDDSGAPQRVSRSELEVRARPPPPARALAVVMASYLELSAGSSALAKSGQLSLAASQRVTCP